jgi:hypothetical protein
MNNEEDRHPNFDDSDSRLSKEKARELLKNKDKNVNTGNDEEPENSEQQIQDETSDESNSEPPQQSIEVNEQEEQVIDKSKADDKSLGQAVNFAQGGPETITSETSDANVEGWKPLDPNYLPTGGIMLPSDIEINIRSAKTREIRHWSIIDESDPGDSEDKINYILERCTSVRSGNRRLSWKDLTDFDRFFILYRIKELTFPNGENEINIKFQCPQTCSEPDNQIENLPLSSAMLKDTFKIPSEIMKYYDDSERMFKAKRSDDEKEITFLFPSIGVSTKLRKSLIDKYRNGQNVEKFKEFYRYAPYMINDWRSLNEDKMTEIQRYIEKMDQKEVLFRAKVTEIIEENLQINVKKPCPRCERNLEAPTFFRAGSEGGISLKDLFIVPNTGLDELL